MRKHPLANCEECPLYDTGQFVNPDLAKTDITVVYDSPKFSETYAGINAGPHARLLNKVLKYHEIKTDDVSYTYAVSCKPATIDSKEMAVAAAKCRPRLVDDLTHTGSHTIVAMGSDSVQTLGMGKGVGTARVGPAKVSEELSQLNHHTTKVISTWHPSYVLVRNTEFTSLVNDIGKIKNVGNTPDWESKFSYRVFDTPELALQVMELIKDYDNFVIDIEVDFDKDSGTFQHPNLFGLLCVGISYDNHKAVVLGENCFNDPRVGERLYEMLKDKYIIGQNGKFDLEGLYPVFNNRFVNLSFDTMLASYTFDERPGVHGLKYMAQEYLYSENYEEELTPYTNGKGGYGKIPREILYKYNALDVLFTRELYEMFMKRYEEFPDLKNLHDFLIVASNTLMRVEMNGITIDQDYMQDLDRIYRKSTNDLEFNIDNLVESMTNTDYDKNGGINPRSPLQIKKFLKDINVNVDSTDEKTLTALSDKLEQLIEIATTPKEIEYYSSILNFCSLLLEYRKEAKAHGTYVKGFRERLYEGNVYPTFSLHTTSTGRLSCRNPNIQNITRGPKIRSMFVPQRSENVLLQTDYSQAELRVLSFLAKDNYFREIFNNASLDVFDDLSVKLYPHIVKSEVSKDEWKETRNKVKAYVYGLSYGRTEFGIARQLKISVAKAKKSKELFFSTIPEIVAWQEQIKESVLRGDVLISPFGRRKRTPLITPLTQDDILNESLAFLPQGTASDICLRALTWIEPILREGNLGVVRNTVHDAVIVECHPNDVEQVKEIIEFNMIESARLLVGDYVRFDVETTFGKSWGEL